MTMKGVSLDSHNKNKDSSDILENPIKGTQSQSIYHTPKEFNALQRVQNSRTLTNPVKVCLQT